MHYQLNGFYKLSFFNSWAFYLFLCLFTELKYSRTPFCLFNFQLIKTHDLLPSRNYVFGYHPHGIFCFGVFCNFGTEATGFSKKFPGIKPSLATLAGNFRLPVLRDYLMSGGEQVEGFCLVWRRLSSALLIAQRRYSTTVILEN